MQKYLVSHDDILKRSKAQIQLLAITQILGLRIPGFKGLWDRDTLLEPLAPYIHARGKRVLNLLALENFYDAIDYVDSSSAMIFLITDIRPQTIPFSNK